ncbi:SULT6B1 [Bugula neritina]|uniref:SULT6B1 n=1 Tax=Bugula neritina TaxID=10212 RepID=A0A7J7J8I0_BUGNE|nr:SULT6B1 [Bugula neritina]
MLYNQVCDNQLYLLATFLYCSTNSPVSNLENIGTHWLWEIIQMLLNSQSQDVAAGVNKCQSFVETQTYSALDDLPSPRVLSTHLMPTGLPSSLFNNSKVVVPIRNPKDTAVSLYYHLKSETKGTNLRCGWDVFIDKVWFDPELAFYAPWTEFTSFVWKKCREEDNYHPVIYEQLLEDPAVIIKDLGSFLGVSCLSDDRIAQIVQATEFNNMKVKKADSEKPLRDTFCEGYSMFRKGNN